MTRLAAYLIGAVVVLVLGWAVVSGLFSGAAAKVEALLKGNQAEAVVSDAQDATSAIGQAIHTETILDRKVIYAQSQVRAAGDPVAADAAGRAGLCAISSDFCGGDTMREPDPR